MIIDQEELTKLCKYLYLKFFDYKDIVLNDIYINANLNYYGIDTKVQAKVDLRVENDLIVDIDGIAKYGFINLSVNKILKEMIKDYQDIEITDRGVIVLNDFLKSVELKNGHVCIELK